MHNNKKIFLSSVVWGEEYIEYFERLCLKSLLNDNISKSKKISFNIYCFKDELNKIKKLKNIIKLKKLISINYFFLKKNKKEKYSYLAHYQKKLINIAKERNSDYFIFCYPDTIFCKDYMKFCTTKLEKFSILFSPAPLVNFESLPKNLDNFSKENLSKIGNNCLSNFYKNRINDFYQKSNINLWKNEHYTYYKSFNLHILAIKLKSIKEIKDYEYKSFDENFFTFANVNYQDIYYVQNSQENIILTVESVTSERNNIKNDKPNFANTIGEGIKESILGKIKKEKNNLNIFSFLHGDYYVVEKKNLSKTINCEFVKNLKFLKKIFSSNRKESFYQLNSHEKTSVKISDQLKQKKDFNFGLVKKKSYEDITIQLYENVTEENYRNYIKNVNNNKFLIFGRSMILIIIILIPNWLLPITNKIFSKRFKAFNRTRHDLKFILFATPKKYILKVCTKNILRLIKND